MLTWIAAVSGLGAAVVVGRWWLHRVDALGRTADFPWIGAGLLAVVCLVTGGLAVRNHLREERLSDVVSALAGRTVTVDCQGWAGSFTDPNAEAGYVAWDSGGGPTDETTLKADVCRALSRYLRSPSGDPPEEQVVAVHILTHEAMHLAGLTAEDRAECAAVQRDAETARRLGASPADAAALARRYWVAIYPRLPERYRTTDCAAGGRLDERRPDAPWATPAPG